MNAEIYMLINKETWIHMNREIHAYKCVKIHVYEHFECSTPYLPCTESLRFCLFSLDQVTVTNCLQT